MKQAQEEQKDREAKIITTKGKKTTTKEVAKGHVDKVAVNGPSIAYHHLMKLFWFIFLATVKRSESLSPPTCTSDLAHYLGGVTSPIAPLPSNR